MYVVHRWVSIFFANLPKCLLSYTKCVSPEMEIYYVAISSISPYLVKHKKEPRKKLISSQNCCYFVRKLHHITQCIQRYDKRKTTQYDKWIREIYEQSWISPFSIFLQCKNKTTLSLLHNTGCPRPFFV